MSKRRAASNLRPPSLPANLLLGLLLPALLVGMGLWLDGEYARMRNAGDIVGHVSARRVRALDLLGSLRKAETAHRGFVITRNPRFLDRYEPSRQAVLHDLDALASRDTSVPQTKGNTARLRKLIAAKFQEMDEVLRLVRAGRQESAVARVSRGQGQRLTNQIEAGLQAIIANDAGWLARGTASYWSARSIRATSSGCSSPSAACC